MFVIKINHNVLALNTYNRLNQNQKKNASSFEKLSSGLRINKGADDAAGLSISEKMRGQIRGLERAQQNSLEGINLVLTGEGSLNEIQNLLQRMREITVQAANDTNIGSDREAIQQEVAQLTSEINRIAYGTNYNNKKLYEGQDVQQVVVKNHREIVETSRIKFKEPPNGKHLGLHSFTVDSDTLLEPGDYTIEVKALFIYDWPKYGVEANLNNLTLSEDHTLPLNKQYWVHTDIGAGINSITLSGGIKNIEFQLLRSVGKPKVTSYQVEILGSDNNWSLSVKDMDGIVYDVYLPDSINPSNIDINSLPNDVAKSGFTFDVKKLGRFTIYADNLTATNGAPLQFKTDTWDEIRLEDDSGKLVNGSTPVKVTAGQKDVDLGNGVIVEIKKYLYYSKSFLRVMSNGIYTASLLKNSDQSIIDTHLNLKEGFYNSLDDIFFDTDYFLHTGKMEFTLEKYKEYIEKDYYYEFDIDRGLKEGDFITIDGIKITAFSSIDEVNNQEAGFSMLSANSGSQQAKNLKNAILANKVLSDRYSVLDSTNNTIILKEKKEPEKLREPQVSITLNNKNHELFPTEFRLQIGANAGQSMTLEFNDMKGKALGISTEDLTRSDAGQAWTSLKMATNGTDDLGVEYILDVGTFENASSAITVIDKAIGKVSSERSKLGSYNNRLEHTVNNLKSASENIVVAESRIRDVNMAFEIMEQTKASILSQASQAMLVQANQIPQSILNLIK